jgi:hypothetical protein
LLSILDEFELGSYNKIVDVHGGNFFAEPGSGFIAKGGFRLGSAAAYLFRQSGPPGY